MDVLATYAATSAVMASLIVFSVLVLFGVWLVRVLKLPQDLPPELHFEPPPPPLRVHADRAEAAVVAQRQARLRAVHQRAFVASQCAEGCREVVAAAQGMPALIERASAVAARAKAAAEAADQARKGADLAVAEEAVAHHAAEAEAAWKEAEVLAKELPATSRRRLWLLIALAVLALAWLAAIIATRHVIGPHAGPG